MKLKESEMKQKEQIWKKTEAHGVRCERLLEMSVATEKVDGVAGARGVADRVVREGREEGGADGEGSGRGEAVLVVGDEVGVGEASGEDVVDIGRRSMFLSHGIWVRSQEKKGFHPVAHLKCYPILPVHYKN